MEKDNNVKIRINLSNREFEVEANSDFVMSKFGKLIEEYMTIIKEHSQKSISQSGRVPSKDHSQSYTINSSSEGVEPREMPDNFGEFLNKFPKSVSNVDKLLIAGYFVQTNQEGKFFTMKEASNLLKDQGINLSNPTVFLKSIISTKRVFKLTGKNYRVSDSGVEYIKSILAQS